MPPSFQILGARNIRTALDQRGAVPVGAAGSLKDCCNLFSDSRMSRSEFIKASTDGSDSGSTGVDAGVDGWNRGHWTTGAISDGLLAQPLKVVSNSSESTAARLDGFLSITFALLFLLSVLRILLGGGFLHHLEAPLGNRRPRLPLFGIHPQPPARGQQRGERDAGQRLQGVAPEDRPRNFQ